MEHELGYGIIGCGWVSSAHAWGIRGLADEGVHFVAVADTDTDRARELAKRFDVPHVLADYRELLARDDIQVVSVCLPDFLHEEVTLAAAAAGKHVLCEKPLALDLASADRMLSACNERGVNLGLVMNHRYAPDNIRAKTAIRGGAVGRQLIGNVLHSSGLTGDPAGTSPWRGRRGLSTGGVLSTQAIHFLDLLLWFAGPARSVLAATDRLTDQPQEHEDTASVTLRLASGALAAIVTTSGSTIMDDFTGTRIEIHGTNGWLQLEGDELRHLSTESSTQLPAPVTMPPVPEGASEIIFGVGHVHEVRDFVSAVRRSASAPVPGADGRHLMAVLDAAYASAREGRAIAVDQRGGGYEDRRPDHGSLLYAGTD
jgi:UDP-N-acetyl-2-amino-2-deoxyglucuronate dehydrogenase